MHRCTRCGVAVDESDGVVNEEGGYAYCAACEADYQEGLAKEYPHGQCQHCGAAYFVHTNRDGSTEYRAWHAEGQCPNWVDWVGLEEDYDDEDEPASPTVEDNSAAWEALLRDYCDRLRAAAGEGADAF